MDRGTSAGTAKKFVIRAFILSLISGGLYLAYSHHHKIQIQTEVAATETKAEADAELTKLAKSIQEKHSQYSISEQDMKILNDQGLLSDKTKEALKPFIKN